MKITIKRRHTLAWTGWLTVFSFLLFSTSARAVENDFSELPAVSSPLARSSMVMDITRAGSRIVAVGERGHILYSDDEGDSWQQAPTPVSVQLTSVVFPTPEMGWAVGHEGVVLRSQDGGSSWEKVEQFSPQWINEQLVSAAERLLADKTQALDTASEDQQENLANALEDTQYLLSDLQEIVAGGIGQPWMKIWFETPERGILVGAVGQAFETRDSGQSWTPLVDRLNNLSGMHLYAVGKGPEGTLISGEKGVMFLERGVDLVWQSLSLPIESSLFSLVSTGEQGCVLALGFGGNVLRQCEAGSSWEYQQLGGDTLTGGLVLSDKRLLVFGMRRNVFLSEDGGRSFRSSNLGIGGNMAALQTSSGHLLLAGLTGIHKVALNELGGK